jgi:regulator of replication initiation timing
MSDVDKDFENIDFIGKKIVKILEENRVLSEENRKLKLENDYLKKQQKQYGGKLSEYEFLKKRTKESCCKIERLIRKIEVLKVF